jgi:hypothetical protein
LEEWAARQGTTARRAIVLVDVKDVLAAKSYWQGLTLVHFSA